MIGVFGNTLVHICPKKFLRSLHKIRNNLFSCDQMLVNEVITLTPFNETR